MGVDIIYYRVQGCGCRYYILQSTGVGVDIIYYRVQGCGCRYLGTKISDIINTACFLLNVHLSL